MQKLLVPTDFSPEAHHAFKVALWIAHRTGGSVTLLHVVELPEGANFSTFGGPVGHDEARPGGDGMERLFALKLLEATKHRMHTLIAEARQSTPSVPVYDMVLNDRIGPAILTAITERQIDLVVMGAQGHTALDRLLMGSNTERLVRLAPCPVLAVKHLPADFEVRTIVFPSDFSDEAARAVPMLQKIRLVFPLATLHLLYVTASAAPEDSADKLARMRAFVQRHHLHNTAVSVFEDTNEETGIQRFAEQTNADLVMLPTHGRTGFSRYLHPSIAEDVAVHAFPPVLTFHLT